MTAPSVEDLLRDLAPQVLGTMVRRFGDFESCEDAVQEAQLAAAQHWPRDGVPDNPRAWLLQSATRRFTDLMRSEQARHRREDRAAREPARGAVQEHDDTLALLFMCCHPSLTPASAVALTLRAVGGLATAEIASAYLVPEATMAQRISRAKQRIRAAGTRFETPEPEDADWAPRLASVLRVLYLTFNEGYAATAGTALNRVELSAEAIRLARAVHRILPQDVEVTGLLSLMLLTDARRPARTGSGGELIPLAEQDRSLWNRRQIGEGIALLNRSLGTGPAGEYRVQAAINALHDSAPRAEDTDWPQIHALYGTLEQLTGSPVVSLNRAVALAMSEGPQAGLDLLDTLGAEGEPLAGHHRLHAVRAHLLEMAGDDRGALDHYRRAAIGTTSVPERGYLTARAAAVNRRLAGG